MGDQDPQSLERLVRLEAQLEGFMRESDRRFREMNKIREEVLKDRSQFLRADVYAENHKTLMVEVEALRLWQQRVLGVGAVVILIASVLGAMLMHMFIGVGK